MPRTFPWQKQDQAVTDSHEEAHVAHSGLQQRLLARHVPGHLRAHLAAVISEFVGTFFFLFFALGGTHVVNTAPSTVPNNQDPAKLLYISLCFGLSLAVNVWAFFRIEGGMFNPAVAFAMFATGGIGVVRLVLVIMSQLVGSIAASGLVCGLLPGGPSGPGGGIAATTTLSDSISLTRAVFLECFLTANLVLVIFMLAIEKHHATAVAPIGIGLALFTAEMVGVFYTGGSLNPARSFGPDVINGYFPSYHWIYWVGPILGGLLAAGFYKLVKSLAFDLVTPGIDEPAWMHDQPPSQKNPDTQPAETNGAGHGHENAV